MKDTLPTHFGPTHPLADVAARHCDAPTKLLMGGVACGQCWERAIRDDERIVVEYGLPRDLTPDPDYVDEIAVALACRGERVTLTPVEFRAAVSELLNRRLSAIEIARRLHTTYAAVVAARQAVAPALTEIRATAPLATSPIRLAA